MKKTFTIFSLVLFFSAITINASAQKSQVTVFDGEMTWSSFLYANVMVASDAKGNPALWGVILQTIIGNSSRSLSISFMVNQEGTYSAVFNGSTEKWSNPAIANVRLNVDYDGVPYPTWIGQSATLTIQKYNKRKKRIDATLNAILLKEGSNQTRTIQVVMKNLDVSGKK